MTEQAYRFSTPIEIRFRDLDAFGHVNNAVYFTYMELTRMAYCRHIGLWRDGFPAKFFIIAEATCQFKAPILMSTALSIKARVSRLSKSSFDIEYEFVDTTTDQVMATGRTVQVMFDYEQRRSVLIPADWRMAISAFEGL